MEFKNADELRNGCPDLVKEIVDEAMRRHRSRSVIVWLPLTRSRMQSRPIWWPRQSMVTRLVLRSSLLTVRRWMQRRRATNCWMIPKMMQIPAAPNSVGGAAPDGVSGTGTKNKNQTDAEKRAMVKNLFHPKKEG